MRATRTKLIITTSLSILLGLTACSSKKSAFPLQQKDERWFCTPQGAEEWLCRESNEQFEQLAKNEPARQLPSSQEDSDFAKEVESDEESENDFFENTFENTLEDTTIDNGIESLKEPAVVADSAETAVESTVSSDIATGSGVAKSTEEKTASETPVNPTLDSVSIGTDSSAEKLEQSNVPSWNISPWVIQLAAYSRVSSAESLMQQVEGSQRFNTEVKGKQYITVVITGFDTRWQVLQRVEQLQQQYPQLSPWVRSGDDFEQIIIR